MFGTLPRPPELKYDPEAAKKLLAEAGYPNGFELAVSSTNDRYTTPRSRRRWRSTCRAWASRPRSTR